MQREIELDGGEITLLKALGTSGNQVQGKLLLGQMADVRGPEFLEILDGLMERGYVISSKVNVMKIEDVERSSFRVNPSYSRDLRNAMRQDWQKDKERRRRRT